MSSTLRLSIIMVLLLATAALGLFAYNMNLPKPVPVVQVTENTPAPPPAPVTVGYFVAAHPLPAGTLAREEDFTVRSVSPNSVPSGAIIDTPEVRIGLRGSLVRTFLDTGSLVTSQNVLRPRDRGFLASVLEPGTRAISIKVDAESGVSGLIWPGDYVDVVLTQVIDEGRPRQAKQRGNIAIAQNARRAKPFFTMFESSRLTRRLCKAAQPVTPRPVRKRKLCHCSLRQSRSRRSQSQNSSESSPWPCGQRSINRDTADDWHYVQPRCVADNCPPECNGGG